MGVPPPGAERLTFAGLWIFPAPSAVRLHALPDIRTWKYLYAELAYTATPRHSGSLQTACSWW